MINILIVDDEAELRQCLQMFLERQGCRVWTAATGQEALALLQAHRPGVLLLDLNLGRGSLSGFEVLRQGRAVSPETRVIVISGAADETTKAEALTLGATRYLEKPHSVQRVFSAVGDVAGEGPGTH
ncbi:MAG: response regulator [Candidatus Omnitrophica bacterium]|nr:response regulator [Candidatus Omnitrophota bacterium]